jgi:hypothetical protein
VTEFAKPGKTFAELIIYACEHPINPVIAPKSFDDYAADAGPSHKLLVVTELEHGGYVIHASISNMGSTADPELLITLSMLAAFGELLGVPARWALLDHIVHWYWPADGVAAQITAARRHH